MHSYDYGFSQPVRQAQESFRQLLDAMSHPGDIRTLQAISTPDTLQSATLTTLLTLTDNTTPVWFDARLDTDEVRQILALNTGAGVTSSPMQASFAVIDAESPFDATNFDHGSEDYPDRSCTLLVQCHDTETNSEQTLSGPGLQQATTTRLPKLHRSLSDYLNARHRLFPMGLDVILCQNDSVRCLPRSTIINEVF